MSEGKIASYTVVPQKSVMQEFIEEIERKRREEMERRERLFQQQALSLRENAQKYLIENALKELNELRSKFKEYGLEDSVIIDDDDKSKNSDAYFQFLLLQIRDAKSKLGQAYTKKMDSDLYSLGSSLVSGAILKASDVLKKPEEEVVPHSVVLSKDYALLRDQREQVAKEIEHFQNDTGSVFDKTMLGLIEQFDRSTELSSATSLTLSIKAEIAKQYNFIENEKSQARKLYQKLSSLGADDEYTLLQMLLKVQEGKARLDRATVKAIEDKIREIEEEAVQQASTVLISGLEELGYEVRGIEETLFVNGGEFYFRKENGPHAWDPHYYVRGKVNPKNQKVTFIMGYEGKTMHSKEQDYRIEEQFCSELGTLQDSLKKNNVQVTIEELIMPGNGELINVDINKVFMKKPPNEGHSGQSSTQNNKAQSTN